MDMNQGDNSHHPSLERDRSFSPQSQYNGAAAPIPPSSSSSSVYNQNTNADIYSIPSYASLNVNQFYPMPGQDNSISGGLSIQTGAAISSDQDPSLQQQPQQQQPYDNAQAMSQFGQNPPAIDVNIPKLETSAMPFEDFSNNFNAATPNEAHSSIAGSPYNSSSPHTFPRSINPAELSRQPSPNSSASPHPPSVRYSNADPLSPVSSPAPFYTPQHSRHTSLDPSTAAYMSNQPNTDWQGLLSEPHFRTHRSHTRAPSEVSDVSSVSHSPFPQHDAFEYDNSHSPLLVASDNPFADNTLGMESFTISDFQRSPYDVSPNLMPQNPSIDITPSDSNFLLVGNNTASHHQHQQSLPNDTYMNGANGAGAGISIGAGSTSSQPLDNSNNLAQSMMAGDMGQAAQMTPPSINVEFAPPSRQASFGPKPQASGDTLSLPMARRGRSKSDPFGNTATRSVSESAIPSNTLTTTLSISSPSSSLSPSRAGNLSTPGSRNHSPVSRSRRQSTSSIENRNYILDLADPQRPGGNVSDNKRVQKHPASFQCSLCPKRFTRAYNLRSHLRTHTDERPFVCTVCGKAFARQHDRKRHEGLHSGEKKFVCNGTLKSGKTWGCGRRFARADALGRHFRSEAGRICIKPLLDEEAAERERDALQSGDNISAAGTGTGTGTGTGAGAGAGTTAGAQENFNGENYQHMSQPMMRSSLDMGGTSSTTNTTTTGRPSSAFMLPQALIAQYPALRALNWDQMAAAAAVRHDDGSHTPYDASSAGELSFTEDDGYLSSSSQIQTSGFHSPSPLSAQASTGSQQQQQGLGVPTRPSSALSADAAWQQNMDLSWGSSSNQYGFGGR